MLNLLYKLSPKHRKMIKKFFHHLLPTGFIRDTKLNDFRLQNVSTRFNELASKSGRFYINLKKADSL